MSRMRIWMAILTVLIILPACGALGEPEPRPPGPSVSPVQAKQVAKEQYDLVQIDSTEVRHLTAEEWKQLTSEQRMRTPVYFVMKGRNSNGDPLHVYVSSNSLSDGFVSQP